MAVFYNCSNSDEAIERENEKRSNVPTFIIPDTSKISNDYFGEMVRYGRELMLNTAYYIGPNGKAGKYTGNQINCTNCHQDAGTKPYSFNLLQAHDRYPQYRAREGRVLTLTDRVNNCVQRPGNGKPLPLDSREMTAFLSYLKWINEFLPKDGKADGLKNLEIKFPDRAADPDRGAVIYAQRCSRCHMPDGGGFFDKQQNKMLYPALWGDHAYQPGSSMHRVIKMAQWLKANMPYDSARWNNVLLTDEEALDVAAFVNHDEIHKRPNPPSFDYPRPAEKAIDYGIPPFADTFPARQHKFGPYQPIIDYWKKQGMKPTY